MSKIEIKTIIQHKFPNLSDTDQKILEEYCLAVEYRLNQVPEAFNESQCLKSWEQYKLERSTVYNAIGNRQTFQK